MSWTEEWEREQKRNRTSKFWIISHRVNHFAQFTLVSLLFSDKFNRIRTHTHILVILLGCCCLQHRGNITLLSLLIYSSVFFSFIFFHFILFMRCLLLSLFSIYTLRDSGIKTKKLVPILKKIEFEIEPQNVSVKKWNSFYLHWIYFKHSRTRWYLAVLFFKVSQHHFLDRMIMA